MAKRKARISPRKISGKKRSSKSGSSKSAANKSELERIEDLLDEDFSSLAEARRALASETNPRKDSYTVRELSTQKHKKFSSFISDLESHVDEIDEMKPAQDYWAAEIRDRHGNFHKTYSFYNSIGGLARLLGTYKGLQEESPTKFMSGVRVVRVKGRNASIEKYLSERRKDTEQSWKRTREKHKQDKRRRRKQERKIKSLQAKIKELRKKLRQK